MRFFTPEHNDPGRCQECRMPQEEHFNGWCDDRPRPHRDARDVALAKSIAAKIWPELRKETAEQSASWDETCRRTALRAEELRQKRGW